MTTLFLATLKAGDHAIISDVVYGGTVRLFVEILNGLGVRHSSVDTSDPEAVERAVTPQTRIILIETPGNPTMKLTDIAAIAEIARRHNVLLAVDNTFLTPVLQRPIELGADISVLSTTKYIEGHNSTVGGSLACNDEKLLERFRLIRKTVGAIQAPLDAWLTLRGLKTLPVRMKAHSESAATIAEWLEAHPAVSRVYYPGLDSFPQKALAERQQSTFGGMLELRIECRADGSISRDECAKAVDPRGEPGRRGIAGDPSSDCDACRHSPRDSAATGNSRRIDSAVGGSGSGGRPYHRLAAGAGLGVRSQRRKEDRRP